MSEATLVRRRLSYSLLERVSSALRQSPYTATTPMEVEAEEGAVRLSGRVGTFFEKQMAQEVVRRLDGVESIENHLEVNWR